MSDTTDAVPAARAPFSDARSCKEFLGGLPLTNLAQAQSVLLGGLRHLNSDAFSGMERLKCLELARDKVVLLVGEQRAKKLGRSLPLAPNDVNIWLTGRSLVDELETGYRKVLVEGAGNSDLSRLAALVLQRIVRCTGMQLLFHSLVYRHFDASRWERLHAVYRQAVETGMNQEHVKDSLESDESGSSVTEAYARVLLLGGATLAEKTPAEIEYVDALVRLWVRKVKLTAPAPEGSGAPDDLTRLMDTTGLSMSMRKRLHALKKDEPVEKLGLPEADADIDLPGILQILHRSWCEAPLPRPPGHPPSDTKAGLIFGTGEIHFFLTGGKTFEQPDKKRELSSREKQDIEVFGRVREQTQSKMMAANSFTVDPWEILEELMGAWRLLRPPSSSRSVTIGKLVAIRVGDTAAFFLGAVSALEQEADGRMVITVRLFPGKPEPIAVRAADARNRSNAKWSEGFRLPAVEKLKVPETLVLPAKIAQRGRGVETWVGEPKESTVYEIVEHGSDFDRITVF